MLKPICQGKHELSFIHVIKVFCYLTVLSIKAKLRILQKVIHLFKCQTFKKKKRKKFKYVIHTTKWKPFLYNTHINYLCTFSGRVYGLKFWGSQFYTCVCFSKLTQMNLISIHSSWLFKDQKSRYLMEKCL